VALIIFVELNTKCSQCCFFVWSLHRVSKNVANIILNNFNKLEPILIFFAYSISRIFATNNNYVFLLNLLRTYFTLQYLKWRKWRVAITSSFAQIVIDKVVDQWHTRLRARVEAKAIILNICYTPLLISVGSNRLFRATHRFQRKTAESFIFVVKFFSGSVAT